MWGALLRSGEFLVAKRRQLLLPSDALGTMTWALLSLEEPKTRFSAARHQSAKLDWPDLVELVELAFAHLPPHANLWPQSGQTFRTRFKSLMLAMGLPTEKTPAHRILDLGSMRPGGATHLLQTLENSETVRRRGRWMSHRVMEIYLQEVSSILYLKELNRDTLSKVIFFANLFPRLLEKCKKFHNASIPWNVYFILLGMESDL